MTTSLLTWTDPTWHQDHPYVVLRGCRVLSQQLASATDESERAELASAVEMAERITGGSHG